MTDVPDESVDAIITDPPYPNGIGAFTESLVDGIAMVYLACKKAKHYVVFFWKASDVPKPPTGWYEVARHIWHKPDAAARTKYEAIVVWSKERKYRSGSGPSPSSACARWPTGNHTPRRNPCFSCGTFVEEYTQPGELVLDPFVGVGATAIACQQLGRDYIGIDNNPEFTKIARERLAPKRDRITPAERSEPEAHEAPEPKRKKR